MAEAWFGAAFSVLPAGLGGVIVTKSRAGSDHSEYLGVSPGHTPERGGGDLLAGRR